MNDDVNLLYTDVETALRESVSDLLTARCSPEKVIAVFDGDREIQPKLWRSLALDLGLAGLLVPEERGGAGASAREAAVVLEELGRFAAPVPFLTSSVIASAALLHAGDDRLLATVASGERTAAVVVPFSTAPNDLRPTVRADGQGALNGRVTSVAGALEADVLLVPVAAQDGVELHAVEAGAASVTPVVSMDMTRQLADVDLDAAPGTRVVEAGGDTAVRGALELGAALIASEQLGVAQWCLDTTVSYLRERTQFGRSVGGFQAIKHRLADLYVTTESARAAARYAAATAADEDSDRHVAALMAKSYCSEAAVRAAEECVQLHGGIGMTWEHPAHLYLKRAKADQIALGNPQAARRQLGELVDLPMPPAGSTA
ncbi:alkylation response protein AidB-like acyl-CoA dehydrogenase [Lipingzhangella halophila]|uniref:Alkylation response protein AidB-like acyl-CoA dehydrogenase n=1 Tax=Lipingzhangella halophila TaxID=1783352 RepID=A0A7W7W516_9ACTN|nr:acyl-CoA dehydrogenase family protein [Lipingzhangella halophila]MBB4933389.1 alkylation response protein AidB-like acyl-CoA dehydrogenase [Lipingzhangella halophila]